MATKAKTSTSTSAAATDTLQGAFSEGLKLLDAGKLAEAEKLFQQLEADASAQGEVALARSVRVRLAALKTRLEKPESVKLSSEMTVLLHLNRQESDEALAIIEKALASKADDSRMHYLKATAMAQKQDAAGAAEAMKSAIALDPNLIHLFRSEKDFDSIRHQAPMAAFELD